METQLYKSSKDSRFILGQLLAESLEAEVNIYNQAYLELDRPVVKAAMVHPQTKYEIGISFDVTGELSGKAYCFLDTYQKTIKEKEERFFKLLFVESMNILLGRTLTNLEEKSNLLSLISSPQYVKEQSIEVKSDQIGQEVFSMGYKLIAGYQEYDCRIIFDLKKNIS